MTSSPVSTADEATLPPRVLLLDEAKRITTQDRNKQYGDAVENFAFMEEMMRVFDKYYRHDHHTKPHYEAMRMVMFKIMRIANGQFKEDNYIDAVNYLVIAAECDIRLRETQGG